MSIGARQGANFCTTVRGFQHKKVSSRFRYELQAGFLPWRGSFTAIERWQMDYLPVLAIWAALVVLVFPPLFGFA